MLAAAIELNGTAPLDWAIQPAAEKGMTAPTPTALSSVATFSCLASSPVATPAGLLLFE